MDKLTMPMQEIIDGCGFVHQHSVLETYPLHTHDFYEIFYIVSGMAVHNINDEEHFLQTGDLVLIRPDDIHSYAFLNNWDFELISIGIPKDEFFLAIHYLEMQQHTLFTAPSSPTISIPEFSRNDILNKLLAIPLKAHGLERHLYFRKTLIELLYLFLSEKIHKTVSLPKHLSKVLYEMNQPENFTIGLKRMLEVSDTSQEHLTREFRKYLCMTPTEFINLKRLNYAAQFLSECKQDITEICYLCGFNSLSHFYHKFKEHFGCSPSKFITYYDKKIQGNSTPKKG